MDILKPFKLLELNLISAQDLQPVDRRKMRVYAVAWVNPQRKLTTRIDTQGHTNPTWNDKFVFRVDDEFLACDTSAVMIEIYAVHWFRDIHVGTVRAIVGNLIQSNPQSRHRREVQLGMRFVALQVRRPSGRPQGILNVGLTVIDSSRRSMPLYVQMGSSAVGYQYLMGEEDANQSHTQSNSNNHWLSNIESIKPELRRTMSDSSSMLGSQYIPRISIKGTSIINGGDGSENNTNYKVKSRGSSIVNYTFQKSNKKGESSSTIKGLNSKIVDTKGPTFWLKRPLSRSSGGFRINGLDSGATKNDSDLGLSPSEVAAVVAKNKNLNKMDEVENSLVRSWSLGKSMEGLDSKLERWRTKLPPVYDRYGGGGDHSSGYTTIQTRISTPKKKTKHGRKRSSHGGLFSCFGNICGCEISVTCGPGGAIPARKKRNLERTPSGGILSFL